MKKIMIVGANFKNKGAQSMLFVTSTELKKRNEDCEIYFATLWPYNESNYYFRRVCYSYESRQIALGRRKTFYILKSVLKDAVKKFIGRGNSFLWSFMELKKILPSIDLMLDVSGYALGDRWPIENQERYLDGIRLAKKFNIPIVMLSQSFGPFNYNDDKEYLLEEIAELLRYPDLIFARETQGYRDLVNKFRLGNVRKAEDIVLQSKNLDKSSILKSCIPEVPVNIVEGNSVAIIPNMHCFDQGNEQNVMNAYKNIIQEMIAADLNIYIIKHSEEDLSSCENIYELFKSSKHVHLVNKSFSCFEYDNIVKKFNFIVCSRYHGVVHAYRNGVPVVILGWAEKYVELAATFQQSSYVFNITENNINVENIRASVKRMVYNYPQEKQLITQIVKGIQNSNCFDFLDPYLQ